MRFGSLATCVALLLGLAACQTAPAPPDVAVAPSAEQAKRPAPDPADAALLQSMVDAVADGDKVFLVEGDRYVRHIQSGMLCFLDRNSPFTLTRLLVFPTETVGDDVGCDHVLPGGKLTVFATRKQGLTLDDYLAGTVNSMLRMFPDAKSRNTITLRHRDLGPPRAASFDVTLDGRPYVTTAWIAEEGDWFVTVRSTYPAEAGNLMEMQSAAAIMPAGLSIRAAEGR